MLKLENVGKTYVSGAGIRVEVLRGIHLEIPERTSLSIQGISGSGKTTLLNLLGALDRPTQGGVFWRGKRLDSWADSALARWRNRSVGLIFQAYHLLPELNALENVLLPAWFARKENRSRACQLLEEVGLKDRMTHRPFELSGGEQQRVGIARALMNDPEILLADEPTGNLDRAAGEKAVHLLLDLARQKQKSLVFVSHDPGLPARMDVRYLLEDGVLRPV